MTTTRIYTFRDDLFKVVEPMKEFLTVSKRKQHNQCIGLVNCKKGLWMPLQDVNDNGNSFGFCSATSLG
jgi:hypothetical protein